MEEEKKSTSSPDGQSLNIIQEKNNCQNLQAPKNSVYKLQNNESIQSKSSLAMIAEHTNSKDEDSPDSNE